jgi:hypothetical protein
VSRREVVGQFFPAPLVATALLLVLLILLTPVLVPNGQPAAGTILTQAELIVDRNSTSNVTTFYLRALGSTVRYAEIDIGTARGFNWTGSFPGGSLNWSAVTHEEDLLAFQFNSTANPVALNLTVLYTVAGGSAYYVGMFAFDVPSSPGSSPSSLLVATSTGGTSLASGVTSEPLAALPLLILLANNGGSP